MARTTHSAAREAEGLDTVSREILGFSHAEAQGPEFLVDVSRVLLRSPTLDRVDVWLLESGRCCHSRVSRATGAEHVQEVLADRAPRADNARRGDRSRSADELCGALLRGEIGGPVRSERGAPAAAAVRRRTGPRRPAERALFPAPEDDYPSIALVPFGVEPSDRGVLALRSTGAGAFPSAAMTYFQGVAQLLGVAIGKRRAHLALRERVKELTCLYGIARLIGEPDAPLPQVLKTVADLLPPGWQYPSIARGRVVLDDREFLSGDIGGARHRMAADIVVGGNRRGLVEVAYVEERPEIDEGPFLREERNLIDAVGREIGLLVERQQTTRERLALEEQLRHADRLATLGQLSAGVAHELNEPLGAILGFAQLVQHTEGLPVQTASDLQRIVAAVLHAREVIRKLMLFARQSPPRKERVNLNSMVKDGLYFVRSRCAKSGIEVSLDLAGDVPEITADSGQLYQVLVNLAVNAVQAMPSGGRLFVRTVRQGDGASLIVEDTGMGMDDHVRSRIFTPFFTTKDVNEGTGLGLAVVHGIVRSHGGSISVQSEVGVGTRFAITLPREGQPDTEVQVQDDNAGS